LDKLHDMFLALCIVVFLICVAILIGQRMRKKVPIVLKEDEARITDRTDEINELRIKQESQNKTFAVSHPYYNCFQSIKKMEDPYFTYSKPMAVLQENLKLIIGLPNDEFLKVGIMAAKQSYKTTNGTSVSAYILRLMDDPAELYKTLDKFHKNVILESVEPFHNMWKLRVRDLQRSSAKVKRKEYVLNGYYEMKKELLLLKPLPSELQKLENKITEIKNENWELI